MKLGRVFFFLLIVVLPVATFSQNKLFTSQVIAADSSAVPAVITIQSSDSTVIKKMITDSLGHLTIQHLKDGKFILHVSALGFEDYYMPFSAIAGSYLLPRFVVLQQSSNALAAVVVAAKKPAVVVKNDTLEFNASAIRLGEDASTEDIFQKLPGIEVSKSGAIKASGETVTQIYVDGKPYFGADIKAVTQNFPADMIDKIQVINKKPEGTPDDGSYEKIINITLKKNKKRGVFGNTALAAGTPGRYDARSATNYLHYDTKLSVIANTSNTNNGNTDANAPGNLATTAVKASYAAASKKMDVSIWTTYNSSNNKTSQQLFRENFLVDSSGYYAENNNGQYKNRNIGAGLYVEYRPDSFSVVKINQSAGFSADNSSSNAVFTTSGTDKTTIINEGSSSLNGNNKSKWLNGSINYNRRLAANGRSFNFELANRLNTGNGRLFSLYHNIYPDTLAGVLQNRLNNQENTGKNVVATASYNEPVTANGTLSFSYGINYNNNELPKTIYAYNAATGAYDLLLADISNHFDNTSKSGTAAVTYNYHTKKAGFFAGLRWKQAAINSNTFNKDSSYSAAFSGLLPNAGVYITAKKIQQNLDYNMYIRAPDAIQLQPIIDNTNPLYTRLGNPDLQYSVVQTLKYKLNWYSSKKETGLNALASISFLSNNISTNLVYDETTGKQVNTPINTGGAYNWNAWCTFYKPFHIGNDKLKWNVNVSGSGAAAGNLLNGMENTGTFKTMRVLTGLIYDGKEWLDVRTNVSFTKQSSRYSLQQDMDVFTGYITVNPVITVRPTAKTEINIDYDYRSLKGSNENLNNNVNLLNANIRQYVDDKKAIAISLKAFDLLNENNNTTRIFGDSYMLDTTTNTLSRYFMLSVSFRLQHFN